MSRNYLKRVVEVADLDDPRIGAYRNLKERTLRGESIFIAEGSLVVERLLASSFQVESLLITQKEGLDRPLSLVPEDVPIYYLEERLAVNRLVGFDFSRGILAVGKRKELPTMLEGFANYFSGDKNREPDPSGKWPIRKRRAWVMLPDATKPDNLGLAFRCGAALDAEAVILGEQCCDPFSRRALRVSMGGVLQTPIYQAKNLKEEIAECRKRWGIPFYATILDDRAISAYDFASSSLVKRHEAVFVFGNEYSGLDAEMVSLCDESVKIPMRGDVDSLNLGVSVGIFLYEFNRWN